MIFVFYNIFLALDIATIHFISKVQSNLFTIYMLNSFRDIFILDIIKALLVLLKCP